ncbi:hypothetical protein EDC01DRAFT_676888 [Geopyxis carbonaria]|nr:hypothetical protein EDC01DRAFT_676888 [Geopyxis carbonaria]
MTTPRVHTYHCNFCSHLILASTHTIPSLPRRRAPGLDNAIIVPLPPPPKTSSEDGPQSASESSDSESEAGGSSRRRDKDSYTLLLTLTRDRAAKVITREDGFEKRYLWRCGRCRLIVGYQLDECHYEMGGRSEVGTGTVLVGGGDAGGAKDRSRKDKTKRRDRGRYLYVLPGAVVETEDLGKETNRRDVDLMEGVES